MQFGIKPLFRGEKQANVHFTYHQKVLVWSVLGGGGLRGSVFDSKQPFVSIPWWRTLGHGVRTRTPLGHSRESNHFDPVTDSDPVSTMNIYVGNLPWSAGDQELEDLFSQFGNVQRSRVILDRETGRSRGFGFVEMDDEGGRKAIEELNGQEMDGRALRINEAQERQARP